MTMGNQRVSDFIEAIKQGLVTPSQMEDIVYAMETAYQDRYPGVGAWLTEPMEHVADRMVKARENAEFEQLGGEAA
jgi:hypothetical protein